MEYIYFIENTKTNNFKIGKTNNIQKRIKALQTGNDYILTVKKQILCDSTFKIEKIIHRYFTAKRVNGEWFNINMTQVNEISKVINLAKLLRSKGVKEFNDSNVFLSRYLKNNAENKMTVLREILQLPIPDDIQQQHQERSTEKVSIPLQCVTAEPEPVMVPRIAKNSDEVSLVNANDMQEKRPAFVLQFDDRICCNLI